MCKFYLYYKCAKCDHDDDDDDAMFPFRFFLIRILHDLMKDCSFWIVGWTLVFFIVAIRPSSARFSYIIYPWCFMREETSIN